jgi:hypothetical protein
MTRAFKISSIWPAVSRRRLGEIVGEDEGATHPELEPERRKLCRASDAQGGLVDIRHGARGVL